MTEIEEKLSIITKKCSKCKKELSTIFFGKMINSKDGLQYWCKRCKKEYNTNWNKNNPEYMTQWRESNSEYDKQRYENNRERILELNKEYYENNREHWKEYNNERSRKLKRDNPEKYKEILRINNIHKWAHKTIPYLDPNDKKLCLICNERSNKTLNCANIDHRYIKDPQFWVRICKNCHGLLDSIIRNLKEKGD